jgi:ABC-2 type transport system ATP-binding protein/lipopolysaccharide transport system ATP-binding protein
MIQPLIHLENITVRYRVPTEPIRTFKEYAIRMLQGKVSHRDFLALDQLNFDVSPGEVLGIIGQNGAGKSTLLKVIARVLHPNIGRVVVCGRVAPLLDLSAGFHAELTGRENVFLNGAILGYTYRQMQQKYARIVQFADLEGYIEAPMRTYSSGMWARLGFAVATDERPDILLVDEILAVGDAGFQRKCFDRIRQFQEEGTTIILITHNMPQAQGLCSRVAWLHHGKLQTWGEPAKVIETYLKNCP